MRYPWPRFTAGVFLVVMVVMCFVQLDTQSASASVPVEPAVVALATDVDVPVEAVCDAEVMVLDSGMEISEVVLYTRVVSELVKTFYIA